MKHRTHRLRRMTAAVALGVGMVGSVVGLAAGTASAAASTVGTFKSPNGTTHTIPAGTTKNQVIGTLVLTINKTVSKTAFTGQVVTLTVKDTTTHVGSHAAYTDANSTAFKTPTIVGPGSATGCTFATATATFTAAGDKILECTISKTAGTVTATGKTAPAVFTWHTLRVESITGRGKIVVTAADTTDVTFKFTPTKATAAVYTTAAPTTPAKVLLANTTTRPIPAIGLGATAQTAGNWALTLTAGTTTFATTRGVIAGAHVQITVEPHTGTSACPTTKTVAFDGTPKVTVSSTTHTTLASTKIKVSDSLSGNNGCTGFFAPNVLTVKFTSTVRFTKKGGSLTVSITTVKYSVAPKTATGTVDVSDAFFLTSSTASTTGTNKTTTQNVTITSTNAIVSAAYLTTKTPLTTMTPTSYDQPIGTVSVVESAAGAVPSGFVCVTLKDSTRTSTPPEGFTGVHGFTGPHHATGGTTTVPPSTTTDGVFWNTSAAPKVANGATFKFVTGSKSVFSFKVTKSTAPTTYTVSGLAVNTNGVTTARPLVTAFYAKTATCASVGVTGIDAPTDHVAVAFMNTIKIATQIYGTTPDATAAAELEHAFPSEFGDCPEVTGFLGTPFLGKTERPVVLATDKTYPDALSSQYLAGELTTGTLLTPVTSLPQVTINTIRDEGISHVYVVGGPLAVSTTVVAQLQTLEVYNCGGSKVATNLTGQPLFVKVTRIWGSTQYDTAQQIAEYVPTADVNFLKVPAAYGGGPTGNGAYNDTTGTATAKPVSGGPLRTAILSSGVEYQDSEAASALAYDEGLPIILTTPTSLSTQAKNAIQTKHIRQVIVLGGPLAITDTVAKQVAALTVTGEPVSVLRIGGKDYTDTAVQLAKFELGSATATIGLNWDSTHVLVARGNGYTDGIAGAVLEQDGPAPLLLTENPTTVGTYLTTFLKFAGAGYLTTHGVEQRITRLIILGGPLAITPAIILQMETDLKS